MANPPTPDELAALSNNAGGWTIGLLSALGGIRFAWLRFAKDRVTLAGDAADLDAMKRLTTRVNELDTRLRKEEADKRKIMGLLLRVMSIAAQCDCEHAESERAELMAEYAKLMAELEK